MNWKLYHHPDLCLPVLRRRAAQELLDLLAGIGELVASRGRSTIWSRTYPTSQAYRTALSRLRRNGLLVQVDPKASLPHLILTETGRNALPACLSPEKLWKTKWNRIWYTVIFDVPERERHYRDSLRRLLKQMRMGCLQRSVWITPRDIRPQYADLEKSAAAGTVSYLLESRTVLHLDQQEMVLNAWDFERLHKLQSRYLDVFEENLNQLSQSACSEESLVDLLQLESEAYLQAMQLDPLLPRVLLPENYLGQKVWALRNHLRKKIAHAL
jgi:phenylacetic acid degradation operon negative regulatory protein